MSRVLVTGGASGIGSATAELLASRGWEVVRADLAGGPNVVELDVTDPAAWESVVADGQFDALVNSAGIRIQRSLMDLSVSEWEQTMKVNLTGTFLGIQAFARAAVTGDRSGVIVNVASVNSFAPIKGQPHYLASKAGVAMLTKAAALELADQRIRVNAVAPGAVETPMLDARLAQEGQREWLEGKIPQHRLGQPTDIAEGVNYLLSESSGYVTGVVLPIDGGFLLT